MGASLNTGNMGVSALSASLIKIFQSVNPDSKFFFFIGNKNDESQELRIHGNTIQIELLNHRLSPRASFKEHLFGLFFMSLLYKVIPVKGLRSLILKSNHRLKTIVDADIIGDIKGGDSFSDLYGFQRMVFETIPNFIVIMLGKRIVLFPQTFGPYKNYISKIIAAYILKKSNCIMARDNKSMDVALSLLKGSTHNRRVTLCPDVAFSLDVEVPRNIAVYPDNSIFNTNGIIGINVNGLLYNGGYTRNNMFKLSINYKDFILELTQKLLNNFEANLILVPHTYAPPGSVESDNDACKKVYESLSKDFQRRVFHVIGEYNQSEIKNIIGECDFFIGSRMHACIAALSQGIPTIGIAYSRKFVGVFDTVGVASLVVDARSIEYEKAITKICKAYTRRQTFQIEEKVKKAKIIQNQIFSSLIKKHQ